MAIRSSFGIRKPVAILALMAAMFTGACEAEEDPGTDVGDVGLTQPAGDTGNAGDY